MRMFPGCRIVLGCVFTHLEECKITMDHDLCTSSLYKVNRCESIGKRSDYNVLHKEETLYRVNAWIPWCVDDLVVVC